MNSKRPFFSIIILAWCVEEYISECLDSVLTQTFQDFEILLVNVESTDNTNCICRGYAEKHEKIRLISTSNKGQMMNRILGYENAKGAFYICLDGDDCWKPDLLQSLEYAIRKFKCDLIIFKYERFSETGIIEYSSGIFPDETLFTINDKRIIYEKLIIGNPFNEVCTKVMSKEVYYRIKMENSVFTHLRQAEDLLFSCGMIEAANRVLYLDKSLYRYRIRRDSISHKFRADEIKDLIFVKNQVLQYMYRWNMNEKRYIDLFYTNLGKYFADYVYRCATSPLSFRSKHEYYNYLRNQILYKKTLPYIFKLNLPKRHKMFFILFNNNDVILEIYSQLYMLSKKILRR